MYFEHFMVKINSKMMARWDAIIQNNYQKSSHPFNFEFSITAFARSARSARTASRYSGYLFAKILIANNAALIAPGLPTANVPTGIPPGIWTIANNASRPLTKVEDGIGTPNTGTKVLAATTPGKCAAPPAAAIKTSTPRFSASLIYSNNASGVRCADNARASCGILNLSRIKLASSRKQYVRSMLKTY